MEPLNERERDVLRLTMIGKSPDDIAVIFGLHPLTVETVLKQAVEKMNASPDGRKA